MIHQKLYEYELALSLHTFLFKNHNMSKVENFQEFLQLKIFLDITWL